MSIPRKERFKISDDRALQIINNVAEEYCDLGHTNFATKKELCDTIDWVRRKDQADLQKKDMALGEIAIAALKAQRYLP